MICSSSLVDDLTPLILDTSVLINLHACSYGHLVLSAIPNLIAVPEIVVRELSRETSRTKGEHQFLNDLIEQQVVQPVPLDDAEWRIFETLTAASPSLGDGEASTIALAAKGDFCPVIDDAKGRAIAETLINGRVAVWSLDLLLHPEVQRRLGNGGYVEALYLALRDGRMRIDEGRCDPIVKLIGIERALECNSLPGYKIRSESWRNAVRA